MPKDRLRTALDVFGKEYIEELGKELKSAGKDASGNLINSLDSKVLKTGFGTTYTLKILSEDYLIYVDEGRRAGSTPPPVKGEKGKPLRDWVKLKGMEEGAVWGVSKSIGKNGIKATNVIAKALKKVETNIAFRRLEDGVGDWVDDLIGDKLKGLSNNKNITFK